MNVREYRRDNQKRKTQRNWQNMIPKTKKNTEKLAKYDTQDEEKQNKNTTQYELDTTMRKQTQII